LYLSIPAVFPPQAGDHGNIWVCLDEWPAITPAHYYFASDGKLQTDFLAQGGSTPVRVDPRHPVPTVGGTALGLDTCGQWDQTEIESRDDVASFTTAPLNRPLAILGPTVFSLHVSSSANDTDVIVRLVDVSPTGVAVNLFETGVRMRWRAGMDKEPRPLEPNKIYPVHLQLHTAHVFNAQHRIRVHVMGTNYPQVSLNPNNFGPLETANMRAPIVATNLLHHSPEAPSSVTLPTVSLSGLEERQCNPKRALSSTITDQSTGSKGVTIAQIRPGSSGAENGYSLDRLPDEVKVKLNPGVIHILEKRGDQNATA